MQLAAVEECAAAEAEHQEHDERQAAEGRPPCGSSPPPWPWPPSAGSAAEESRAVLVCTR
ncbi:hypothetical protein [Streptomyces atacamensis]|uniref:hypothetical protein n=1 Tax=Streptomyces atacamensis TaxID=531966 RepID=UPI00399CBE0C